MWIPKNEAELLTRLQQGDLFESATFDVKREPHKKPFELAKDVAAMANDGGVLLLGVEEAVNDGPVTIKKPFSLDGQAVRLYSITRSWLQEPPTVEIHTITKGDDPAQGYLVVEIPMSLRAPHMVIRGEDEGRFYGRNGTQNVILTEGEVARLYARRARSEQQAVHRLEALLREVDIEPDQHHVIMSLAIQPLLTDDRLLQIPPAQAQELFTTSLGKAVRQRVPQDYAPKLHIASAWKPLPEGWAQQFHDRPDSQGRRNLDTLLDMEVRSDGGGLLIQGRAGERVATEQPISLFEFLIAGTTLQFLTFFGHLYHQVGYSGPVALGVQLGNLRGAVSRAMLLSGNPARALPRDTYTRSTLCLARQLRTEPRHYAARLVWPLLQAVTHLTEERVFGKEESGP